ncbi:MAG TPA: tail fiber domain-containing protein [Chthoniobacterales bacterium]|jgi:hypothetical protein
MFAQGVGALASAGALVVSSSVFALQPPPGGGYPNQDTALGQDALFNEAGLGSNTAIGFEALYYNNGGSYNTAVGSVSMQANTTGGDNVAVGELSMTDNTTGTWNVAVGEGALATNTTGGGNVALGNSALELSTTAFSNVAIGDHALFGAHGGYNVAIGRVALGNTFAGTDNVAIGDAALSYCSGNENVAIGPAAGLQLTTGNHNIDIGNEGTATDHRTIRIGNLRTQHRAFIAGVSGVALANGVPVMIAADGQLGVAAVSARKEGIAPMEKGSEAILSLQPVTFRYGKEFDSLGTAQFGLVAEEVAKVAPDLVARDAEGKPFSVRYDAVNAMLLNEFLKEHRKVEEQAGEIGALKSALAEVQQALAKQAAQIEKVSAAVTGAAGARVAETNAGAKAAR